MYFMKWNLIRYKMQMQVKDAKYVLEVHLIDFSNNM